MNTDNIKIEKLKRVSIVGTSCSGKTTFAKRLAGVLSAEHVEIDAFNFLTDWVLRPKDEF
jgi:uridine kinase